jgi:hypothetical protein
MKQRQYVCIKCNNVIPEDMDMWIDDTYGKVTCDPCYIKEGEELEAGCGITRTLVRS